ncbi:YbaB/EbfC family nucleoid-associated protein [Actinocorallia sp. B10E7]|uniref:YbaB/EbfC family nucleoid-associated protein n=1 Tax=Actinocorallia sp. B10E7 TaxID=3153558 RepID=UPI00325F02B8
MSDEETSKFDALLNTSTPLAPRSRAEALERLAADETEAPPSPVPPATDGTPEETDTPLLFGGEGQRAETRIPRWAGKPAPNDELEELLRRMAAPRDASTRFLRELEEKRAVLARERVTAEAGGVSVTMDGTGRLISMDISEDLYKGPHLRIVGEKVVEAVEQARTKVMEAAMERAE